MALLLVLVLTAATRPWWRAGPRVLRQREANIAAYRSRLAELELERGSGLISETDFTALQIELAARLLSDAGSAPPQTGRGAPPFTRQWRPVMLMGVLLTTFAAGGYALSGSWRTEQQIAGTDAASKNVEAMVQELAAKMQADPNNAGGWALLGRSYFVEQRYEDAAKAYAEANAHASPPDPEWLTDEGEALAFARDRDLIGRPAQLFEAALALAPGFGKALWYAGLAAEQGKDPGKALSYWSQLSKQDLPAEMREVLAARISALSPDAASAGGPGESAAAAPAGSRAEALPPPVLHVHVTLDPKLVGHLSPDDALFVFAKAEQGPPMPLAVQRFPHAELPAEVTLDDSQGMTPAMKLSQFDHYIVTARVSRGGGALPVSGDMQGSLHVARADAGQPLQLVIDAVVP